MNILIVEDDDFKYSKIVDLLTRCASTASISHVGNVYEAVNHVRVKSPDKIILDMSLPSHPAIAGEGSPISMPAGGIEVILELRSLGKNKIPIAILTQYPDVEVEYEFYSIKDSEQILKDLYDIQCLFVIYYDNESDDWEFETKSFLEK